MVWIVAISALVAGFGLGMAAAYAAGLWRTNSTRQITAEIMRESETRRQAEVETILGNIKASFGDMSLEALKRSTDEFMKLARSTLELEREAGVKDLGEKKSLIDQQLREMTTRLESVSSLMQTLEKDRENKFGELSQHLRLAHEQYQNLSQSTSSLREALASTKARGQWGERMAEDVLRMAGFVEKVNYVKQTATAEGRFPDFTFLLPKNLSLNMDAKFPLDNYVRYLEAEVETERERHRRDFIRDVKQKVKEVKSREYINPAGGTVDYALLFIPNEQIYGFIHENDGAILDDAMRDKVIFCSPQTLFAVLAVIRQAIDNFALEQTSNEILQLMGDFKKQWDAYQKAVSTLGTRLESVNRAYDDVSGVRTRQLEKPLGKIEGLRIERELPAALEPGADEAGLEAGLEPVEASHDDGDDPDETETGMSRSPAAVEEASSI